MQEDVRKYRATFNEHSFMPLRIAVMRQTQGTETTVGEWLEVPPPSQRLAIIEKAHNFGHFSTRKTVNRIMDSEGAWWSGIEADVEAIVSRCIACQRNTAHRVVFHAAQSIPIPTGVWDRVHMDLLELPEADDGSRYLLLFIDALSKYPVGFSLANKEAETVARKLWQVICDYGCMIVIHSDNGREFVNETIAALSKLHGIQQHLITAYRPQANGLVERLNRVVLSVLRKVSEKAPAQWPEWIDFVLLSIRTAVNMSTGYAPFAIMFGRTFHPLANYMAIDWKEAEESDSSMIAALAKRTIQHKLLLQEDWQSSAKLKATLAAETQKRNTNKLLAKRISVKRLKPGTTVFIRKQLIPHKVHHRFTGPFFISRDAVIIEEGDQASAMYILKDEMGVELPDKWPRDFIFEVPQQKVQLSARQANIYDKEEIQETIRNIALSRPGPVASIGHRGEDWFVVERIQDVRRTKKGEDQLLVKWAGYEESQWVPESHFKEEDLVILKRQWIRQKNKEAKRRVKKDSFVEKGKLS